MTRDRISTLPTWLLSRANLRAQRLLHGALADTGRRGHHYRILAALEDAPLSQAELGRRVALDRSDVVGGLVDLETDGLVHRSPDPADRRRNVVRLTPAGRTELDRLHAVVTAVQDEVLAPLDPAERRRLASLLARLGDRMDR
ncbi:DNA-binding MarR family transcriptional regulator [Isoptericola jiangsuensis]|uniref:DNA-binding MarR family transcriptional regulator n=1 Tax=Isoptericola jiangsuensis TaxID=548579 RepID=A0A2A9EU82_9MICO|nr:MarR family transcriptional regulator [Isoptericola jiangsuensis]PFG41729.1 DNA-binding MarR family transcriptional regulator [Isoptericola jiangsuensis]